MLFSFFQQKGGVCKTTLTKLFATFTHYYLPDLRVAVVDLDPQGGIFNTRQSEASQMGVDPEYMRKVMGEMEKNGVKDFYTVVRANINDHQAILTTIENLKKQGYSLIILDFPGNLLTEDVMRAIGYLDYLVIPFSGSDEDLAATYTTISYIEAVRNRKNPKYPLKIDKIVLAQVKKEAKSDVYSNKTVQDLKNDDFNDWKEKIKKVLDVDDLLDIKLFINGFSDTEQFKKKANVSTLLPLNTRQFYKVHPYDLFEEIICDFTGQEYTPPTE